MTGPIVDNPRYERLAQFLAAGMRQSDIARELDFTEQWVCELKQVEPIRTRLQELLEQHAQAVSSRDAISVLERRKSRLQEVVDHAIETPVSAGHRVAAAKELNLMERVYTQANDRPSIVSVTYVFNGVAPNVAMPSLETAQSTQSLPKPAEVIEIEAKPLR